MNSIPTDTVTETEINKDSKISLYKMYRELQKENLKLKAENKLLHNLVESWNKFFKECSEIHNINKT